MTEPAPPTIDTFDLATGSINVAAKMLGITRHALRRRITKYRITWTRSAADAPV